MCPDLAFWNNYKFLGTWLSVLLYGSCCRDLYRFSAGWFHCWNRLRGLTFLAGSPAGSTLEAAAQVHSAVVRRRSRLQGYSYE